MKAIVIGVIFALFASVISSIGPEVSGSNNQWFILVGDMAGWVQVGAFTFGAIVLLVLIIAVINQAARQNIFSRAETAVTTLIGSLFILFKSAEGANSGWFNMFNNGLSLTVDAYYWSTPARKQEILNLIPTIFQPRDPDYIKAWYETAMTPVQWGVMMPTLVYWMALAISAFLLGVFTALLFRRLWIHVESLPFPAVTFHKYLVDSVEVEESNGKRVAGFFGNKYFLIGFVVCAVWWSIGYFKWLYLPGWDIEANSMALSPVTAIGAQIPGHAPWTDGPFIYIGGCWGTPFDLRQAATDAGLPYNLLFLNFNLWVIGWGFLNTIPNLVGLVAASIIMFVILGRIMVSAGIWPETTVATGDWHTYYNLATNDLWPAFFLIGGLAAYLLYPLFRHRASFVPIVKSLFTKVEPEIEKESPIPYRFIWIGSIVFFIITLALGLAANLAPMAWIGFLITITIVNLASAKVIAETGGWYTILLTTYTAYSLTLFIGMVCSFLGGATTGLSSTNFMTHVLLCWVTFFIHVMWWWLMRTQYVTVHAFKLASETKINYKKLLTWIIAAVVVAVVVSVPFDLWFSHALNQLAGSMIWYSWIGVEINYDPVSAGQIYEWAFPSGTLASALGPKLGITMSYSVIGFVFVVLMMFLRARFPTKFIIGPAGLLLSFFVGPYVWTGWLLALIIKWLVLKIGGTKLYNEKALPLFIGCTAGVFLVALFLDFASMFLSLSYMRDYMVPA